ncbi:MAG: hypothetical protein IJB95_06050 [Clostridia bacterium]|nr:hypothetical protein [Clostridia bacterium]
MKKIKDLDLENMEFIHGAHNVYRTNEFIVKQKLINSFNEKTMITRLVSEDTYYTRTEKRDAEYEVLFVERGKEINGKRIHSSMYTRTYVE